MTTQRIFPSNFQDFCCHLGRFCIFFNKSLPFHLPEARSILVDRVRLVLSSVEALSKKDIEILSFGIYNGYFWSKNIKTLKK
jgi:hypothetical protein